MKTLAKTKREPGIWMVDGPVPEVGHNDVLIKIGKTAICGTDMHIYKWDEWSQKTIPVPMTVGHEYVGVVAEIGQEVRGLKIGQRVSGEGHLVCGHCRNCRAGRRHLCRNTQGVGVNRPGAFAEYLVIPAENAFPIPDDIPDDIAAILGGSRRYRRGCRREWERRSPPESPDTRRMHRGGSRPRPGCYGTGGGARRGSCGSGRTPDGLRPKRAGRFSIHAPPARSRQRRRRIRGPRSWEREWSSATTRPTCRCACRCRRSQSCRS